MKAAAQTIRYGGPKTMEHIARYSQKQAHEVIAEFSYQASNPEYPDEQEALCNYLAGGIETELLRQYDKGVFSLAEREDCPVMWSHYGGQHYGICIGYSVPEDAINDVHEVRYGGSRLVKASTIEAMLDGSASARNDVDRAVLLRKAARWSYEREWRLIGKRGLGSSPLELKEVIFGVRCDDSIKFSVATALERRSKTVKMYEIQEVRDSFELKKRRLDDQLFFEFPRRSRDWIDDFDPLPKLTC